ncbi:protein kinase domain-containing protein [Nonomuraea sp. NPDC002799]
MSELRADDPRQLGSYRLTRRLGQGGQGVVYLGHQPEGGEVAVKLLHASLSGDPDVRRRFLGEVEAVRRVAAFCTAQLLDADLEGDRPYLVSEYVEGPSLREHVIAEGPRRGGSLDRLAIGTATALGAIHRAGVVHRDFKPGNVLLGIDGPRVIDFGVSRLAGSTATTNLAPIGTPAYMAPERIKGEAAGSAADLWAWGLTVVYTATGRAAYTADTHQEVLARILYGKPDLGVLSGRLREIVRACLAPEPGDRPDAEEVLRRLLGQDVAGGDVLPTGAMAAVGRAGPAPVSRLGSIVTLGASEAAPGVITDPDPTTSFPVVTASGRGTPATPRAQKVTASEDTASQDTASEITVPEVTAQVGAAAERTAQVGAAPESTASESTVPERAAQVGAVAGVRPGRRRVRVWQAVLVVAGLAMAVAGFVFWLRGGQGPGLEGTWTGSAEHVTAERVFPVELKLAAAGGSFRWGADLHCSGRLGRIGSGTVFTLDRVTGAECYPGTLRLFPTSDAHQLAIKVTRQGADDVTYSGKVARVS